MRIVRYVHLAIFSIFSISAIANEATTSDPGLLAISKRKPVITHNFWHDDEDKNNPGRYGYQCGNQGIQYTPFGDFSQRIRINTDNGWGGCQLAFGIVDPTGEYKDIQVQVSFESTDPRSYECGNVNQYMIPVTAETERRTPYFRLNTDDGPAECKLTFSVLSEGTELDLEFFPDDKGVDQCRNATAPGQWHTAKLGHPVTLGINTHSGFGGCQFSYRLRR